VIPLDGGLYGRCNVFNVDRVFGRYDPAGTLHLSRGFSPLYGGFQILTANHLVKYFSIFVAGLTTVLASPDQRILPVTTEVENIPIHTAGWVYVLETSPDYLPDSAIQIDNTNPRVKIKPQKSWEIRQNPFGMPGGLPSSLHGWWYFDEPVCMIDGNPQTYWTGGGGAIQIRIELPYEMKIKEVVLLTRAQGFPARAFHADWGGPEDLYGNPFPKNLTITLAREGQDPKTVYHEDNLPDTQLGQALRFPFPAQRAKSIVLRGQQLGPMLKKPFPVAYGNGWSLAEIQILDDQGENVALATRGALIPNPSTYSGRSLSHSYLKDNRNTTARDIEPLYYDLGCKWLRCNFWVGPLQWHFVEQERGKYYIDPVADEAITRITQNGINIIMGLEYGNWLYADPPRSNSLNRVEPILQDCPPAPTTPEQIEAYKNWARFMVNHFKGRVKWWEIWNEPSCGTDRYGFDTGVEGVRQYARLIKAVVPVIKEADPEAKVEIQFGYWPLFILPTAPPLFGSIAPGTALSDDPWDQVCREVLPEILPLVDGVEICRVYERSPSCKVYRSIPQKIREWKAEAGRMGFRGTFMSLENQWFSGTHLGIAKNMARYLMQNAGLDVMTCSTSLFKGTDAALPSYYVFRTLSTVMDEAEPTDFPVEFSEPPALPEDDGAFYVETKVEFPDITAGGYDYGVYLWLHEGGTGQGGFVGVEQPAGSPGARVTLWGNSPIWGSFQKDLGVDLSKGGEVWLAFNSPDNAHFECLYKLEESDAWTTFATGNYNNNSDVTGIEAVMVVSPLSGKVNRSFSADYHFPGIWPPSLTKRQPDSPNDIYPTRVDYIRFGKNSRLVQLDAEFNGDDGGDVGWQAPKPGTNFDLKSKPGFLAIRHGQNQHGIRNDRAGAVRLTAPIDQYSFSLPNGDRLVAFWLSGYPVDDHPGRKTDVTLPGLKVKRVVGIDVFNGTEQEMNFTVGAKGTVLHNLEIRDYPLVLRISLFPPKIQP
jgi:hypothetical protein